MNGCVGNSRRLAMRRASDGANASKRAQLAGFFESVRPVASGLVHQPLHPVRNGVRRPVTIDVPPPTLRFTETGSGSRFAGTRCHSAPSVQRPQWEAAHPRATAWTSKHTNAPGRTPWYRSSTSSIRATNSPMMHHSFFFHGLKYGDRLQGDAPGLQLVRQQMERPCLHVLRA